MKNNNRKREWTEAEARKVIGELKGKKADELRELWENIFGGVCYSRNAQYLRKRMEWRLLALVHGGISARAQERAEELVDESLLQRCLRKYRQTEESKGEEQQCIRKRYKGEEHVVHRCVWGYEYRGMKFNSLSAVATHIAGYHVSCTKFFGIKSRAQR